MPSSKPLRPVVGGGIVLLLASTFFLVVVVDGAKPPRTGRNNNNHVLPTDDDSCPSGNGTIPFPSGLGAPSRVGSIVADERGKMSFVWSYVQGPKVVASGKVWNAANSTGWDFLEIRAQKRGGGSLVTDLDRAYASGFVEGALQQTRMWQYTTYLLYQQEGWKKGAIPQPVVNFFVTNSDYMFQQAYGNLDIPFYRQLLLLLFQTQGLLDGHNEAAPMGQKLTWLEVLMMNAAGDLGDVRQSLNNSSDPLSASTGNLGAYQRWAKMKQEKDGRLTDCSAVITLSPEGCVTFGHNTWRYYGGMFRTYKQYDIAWGEGLGSPLVMSSTPGLLSSKDDFYRTMTGNAVMETTLSIFNTSLFKLIKPQSVLTWARTLVALRASKNTKEWAINIALEDSGTYANQWMAINVHDPTTFWVTELLPGNMVHSENMYDVLKKNGHWTSFNIAYFKDIYEAAGYPDTNPEYQFYNCSRYLIFERELKKKGPNPDWNSIAYILGYNEYETDPLSQGDPSYAIASRIDLAQENPVPFGAVDWKVTGSAVNLVLARSGPTYDELPQFCWSNKFPNRRPLGQVDCWKFDSIQHYLGQW